MDDQRIVIKPLSSCTFEQATELWNTGFAGYYSDMSRTVDQFAQRLGQNFIQPGLSVAAFAGDQPAGFVLIGSLEVRGRKLAWNGGTGVHPKHRGKGLAKKLLSTAVDGLRREGIDAVSLEVVSRNEPAIAAYRHAGFQTVDDLIGLKRIGPFEKVPFARMDGAVFHARKGSPAEVSRLPFYRERSEWGCQWFNQTGGDALLITDEAGETAGYMLYRRHYDHSGSLSSISVYQCEPAPGRPDAQSVVRFALSEAFSPFDLACVRTADNLRASNEDAVTAMKEAGFLTNYEQKLMWLELPPEAAGSD